ncbi:hypothetical protein LWH48_06420 [Halomonas sp. G15]|uniref:GntP family permease n=1 Tax=Halomonas sp. G15 TaxID=2903521 RepID=UPI001E53B9E5|nr:hypothetical protein [Halomonas sp. G15]MCE0732436.1 hypothetical protein [Halomonas sp. G15]
MGNELLSLGGIVLALGLLIYLALRGYSLLLMTPVLAALVAISGSIDIVEALRDNYMPAFANFVARFFLIFLFGSIFGQLMADSGAATSVGRGILRVTGERSRLAVIVAIVTMTALLTYGGVSLFVVIFAVIPIARPIFKRIDMAWPLFTGAFVLGMGTFTMTMLPGSPQIQNLIPIPYLDTDPMAGAIPGLVATLFVIPFGLWWLVREDKRYQARGLGYEATKGSLISQEDTRTEFPGFVMSVVPLAILLILLNVFKFSVELSLASAIVAAGALFYKYLEQPLKTFNQGAMNVASPILNTSAVVGFGGVVTAVAGFTLMKVALLDIPGHPLISFAVAVNVLVGITGSASGGLGIALDALATQYLPLVNAEALHRIATISSGGLDALPHSGAVVTMLMVMGLSHREGYRPIFFLAVVAPIIALAFAIAAAIILY